MDRLADKVVEIFILSGSREAMGKSSGRDGSSGSSKKLYKYDLLKITNGRSSKKVRAAKSPSPKRFGVDKKDMGENEVESGKEESKIEEDSVVELSPTSEAIIATSGHSSRDLSSERKATKSGKMLDKISEKASKFLPNKANLGKFFPKGEKEPEVPAIYTIDREMGRTNMAFQQDDRQPRSPTREDVRSPVKVVHGYISPTRADREGYRSPNRDGYRSPTQGEAAEIETFHRSELTDRLRKTRHSAGASSPVNAGKGVAVQASDYPGYRLNFVPPEDFKDPDIPIITLTRVLMCQCTIALFLLVWIIFGALVFYLTEGPYESDKIDEFKTKEKELIIELATDLRLIAPENNTDWVGAITKYTKNHADTVRAAVANSYGNQQPFWTFPGCLMYCVSLLTTLGLAAPLPMTIGGQVGSFIFTLLGFPLHVFFLLNLGHTIAVKTQIFAKHMETHFLDLQKRIINVRRFGEDLPKDSTEIWPEKMFLVDFKPPPWLSYFPIVSTFLYYLIGFLLFGVARSMSFPRIFLFFIDFSSTTGMTNGMTRIGYTWYLEGAAILTAVNAIIYKDSPFEGLTPMGIKLGFMTNSLD